MSSLLPWQIYSKVRPSLRHPIPIPIPIPPTKFQTHTRSNTLPPTADFSNGFGPTPLTADTWGSVLPYDQIDVSQSSPGAMYVYQTAKTAAEKRIWELADQNPDVDVATSGYSSLPMHFIPSEPIERNDTDTLHSPPLSSLGSLRPSLPIHISSKLSSHKRTNVQPPRYPRPRNTR